MPFPASSITSLPQILAALQALAQQVKYQAGNALITLQTQSVSTNFVFQFLDQMNGLISTLNTWQSTSGLNAYATANLPGYVGTLTADVTAVINSGQACIDWIVANFPKDSTNTWILAEKLNADGTRTQRSFTPTQTAGLQTLLQAFINTIG